MNCKYLSKKLNGHLYCKLKKEEIQESCFNCHLREFSEKRYNWSTRPKNNSQRLQSKATQPIKQRTSKQAKLERNRKSIFTDNMDKCYFCPKPKDNIHELIYGKNRPKSIKYHFTLPLCLEHHKMMHSDRKMIEEYQDKCQRYYEKNIGSREDFIKEFNESFIDKHKKRR